MMWPGAEIKRRRLAADLTQQQLADAIGASRRAVIAWETGESYPQGRFAYKIEEVLGGEPETPDEPSVEDGPGPLLSDADFTATINHLIDLHNAALRGQIRQVLRVEDTPLPADLPEHDVIEGPTLNEHASGETGESRRTEG